MAEISLFPYGPPQEGMLENFRTAVSEAQKLLAEVMQGLPRAEEETMTLLQSAWVVCAVVLEPGKRNLVYDLGGVVHMLAMGMKLQESSFPQKEHILGFWRAAVIEYPMPHRYAPAVAWAFKTALADG